MYITMGTCAVELKTCLLSLVSAYIVGCNSAGILEALLHDVAERIYFIIENDNTKAPCLHLYQLDLIEYMQFCKVQRLLI